MNGWMTRPRRHLEQAQCCHHHCADDPGGEEEVGFVEHHLLHEEMFTQIAHVFHACHVLSCLLSEVIIEHVELEPSMHGQKRWKFYITDTVARLTLQLYYREHILFLLNLFVYM
jgi:hypothetical protein